MTRYIPINHREHNELKSMKIILNVWTVYTGGQSSDIRGIRTIHTWKLSEEYRVIDLEEYSLNYQRDTV